MQEVDDVRRLRRDDTIFVPCMDPLLGRFVAAIFRGLGCRAEVLQESEATLDLGMKYTAGGECSPCPSTLGSMIATMEERDLDPSKVIYFMPSTCGPCRFGQYSTVADLAFKRRGWEQIRVLAPNAGNAYGGLHTATRRLMWHAIIIADVVRKIVLKVRPYELARGTVNELTESWLERLDREFESRKPDLKGTLKGYVASMKQVSRSETPRPRVGIVGEIYVRSDPFINKNLIEEIEAHGGEALASTIAEWIFYCAAVEDRGSRNTNEMRRSPLSRLVERTWTRSVERKYFRIARDLIHDREEPDIQEVLREGETYVPWEFETETILTIGRAILFIKQNGVKAVVNASPIFCMPGTISASIFPRVEKEYGVPIISTFYDGSGDPNKVLAPYLHYMKQHNGAKG